MKITIKKLKQVIKETIAEGNTMASDPLMSSWIKFVASSPGYLDELQQMWNIIIAGKYNRLSLSSVPSELHAGIRWHASKMTSKVHAGTVYPAWEEITQEKDTLINKLKADKKQKRKIPTGFKSNPKYQAANDSEKQRWHVYGGDPNEPRGGGGLGT